MSSLSFDDLGTWLDYKSRISVMHSNFFKLLSENHPNLKEKEIKCCALVLEDADTQVLAFHLDMKVRAVLAMKKRIKRKMNLSKEDDLHAHLISLC
jgi:hypothetical protein